MKIVFLGLSITSSWGNGHATTYRGLLRELRARGHDLLFLEREQPWYASHCDLPFPDYCRVELYGSLFELKRRFTGEIVSADAVVVGSYVTEGASVGAWVTTHAEGVSAFYDIDTPVTLSLLARNSCDYLTTDLIPRYDRYLSFTGGPTLARLEREYGSPRAVPLYCSVDPAVHFPVEEAGVEALFGYLGTYSEDRAAGFEQLFLKPAERLPQARFSVAGALYPASMRWPGNVERIEHLSPSEHPRFYSSQRYTLNLTRAPMIEAGYSPSVRLFEAAACGVPIVSDAWDGLETFFTPGAEILIARGTEDVLDILTSTPEAERRRVADRARRRVLATHTSAHRAAELEGLLAHAPAPPLQRAAELAL